jgi:hypothetical protein
MDTRECPVCGKQYGRERVYRHGKPNGFMPWRKTCSRECGQRLRRGPVEDRFWSKVDQSGGPDACWEWTASRHQQGYGVFGYKGKVQKAHRVAYAFAKNNGELPANKVLHSCDNPPCCNPDHLWEGTQQDNMDDMKRKGRRKGIGVGSSNGRAILTDDDVRDIRRRLATGESQQSIANDYDVRQTTISKIKRRKQWAHVE